MLWAESRFLQQFVLKVAPLQTLYSPDGKTVLYTTTGRQLFGMKYSREPEDTKDMWRMSSVAKDVRAPLPFHSRLRAHHHLWPRGSYY